MKKMTALNTHLNKRAEELMAERDSALQDSQDLLNGMQVTCLSVLRGRIKTKVYTLFERKET